MTLTLAAAAQACHGSLHGSDLRFGRCSTDTRTLLDGDVFIALRGPNHDGHDHLQVALERGASALIVETLPDAATLAKCSVVQVEDTRIALGEIAHWWRQQHQLTAVAVTGSNGKTTVKEMLSSILSSKAPVLATRGNLNNDIGLPLTCLSIQPEHRYGVFEMGANHVGEIGYLSRIACPDVAILNNVGPAHLEGFGSFEAVADTKSEIFSGVAADGFAVFNADDRFVEVFRQAASHCQRVGFGFSGNADVRGVETAAGEFFIATADERCQLQLELPGRHNRMNALAACAAALCAGLTLREAVDALASMQSVPGRLQIRASEFAATLIDDTYNANPASVRAAIDVLSEQAGETVLVLGDMRELGPSAHQLHAEVGSYAKEKSIDQLLSVGALAAHAAAAFGANGRSFVSSSELATAVTPLLFEPVSLLFKGSRGAAMEQVMDAALQQARNSNPSIIKGGSLTDVEKLPRVRVQ